MQGVYTEHVDNERVAQHLQYWYIHLKHNNEKVKSSLPIEVKPKFLKTKKKLGIDAQMFRVHCHV